jgi:hypothetical protein
VLRHIQHAHGADRRADGELAAVQRDADVADHTLVLGLQEEVGEVQGPETQLVVLRPGHGVSEGTKRERQATIRSPAQYDNQLQLETREQIVQCAIQFSSTSSTDE